MTWHPSSDFNEFIETVFGSNVTYDSKVLEQIPDEDTRRAGHCLLWAKTDIHFEKIPFIALVNVSSSE